MSFTRRDYCLAGLGLAAIPAGWLAVRSSAAPKGASRDKNFSLYRPTLVDGRTPGHVDWNGRKWRCAMGSTWQPGMDHSLRLLPSRARFEIRDSERDRGPNDDPGKRRSEIRFPKSPRLPNGVPLWGAMSFIHHRWDDPEGMARGRGGGVHGQLHIGSKFGGSPAVAFRRMRNGEFAITTRGENDEKGSIRYRGPLPFDQLHHLVYRVLLHPSEASLAVWLNGSRLVDLQGVSIGSSDAECYWSLGCYYAGGVSCPVVAEFGDHYYPGPGDLRQRIGFRPNWR